MPFSDLGITNKFQMLLQIAKRAQVNPNTIVIDDSQLKLNLLPLERSLKHVRRFHTIVTFSQKNIVILEFISELSSYC